MRQHYCAVALASTLIGCSPGLRHIAEVAGLTDASPPSSVTVSLVCDASSTACSPERLHATLLWALDSVIARPGSSVRLFGLGSDLSSTRFLAEYTSTPSPSPAAARVKAHHTQSRTAALTTLEAAARPLWTLQQQASPIAEGLAAIATFPTTPLHAIVLLSDLREESGKTSGSVGRFECAPLPSPVAWRQRTQSLFSRLRGTSIIVAYASPFEPVANQRCPITIERHRQLADLWMGALSGSGATLTIYPDAPQAALDSFFGDQP
jgi:hypothetical protein